MGDRQQPSHVPHAGGSPSQSRLRMAGFLLYFGAALVCAFYLSMRTNVADFDLWGRMSVGALWHQNGQFPYVDKFSFTAPDAPWIDHEWGSGVVFYWLAVWLGSAGLFWLRIALLTGTLVVVYGAYLGRNRREPGSGSEGRILAPFLIGWILWMAVTAYASPNTVRCQQFSFLLYAVFLWILEECRTRERAPTIWLLPVLMLLWVNLHGGFLYGFGALGLYLVWAFAEKRWRQARVVAIVTVICLAATLMNPYGIAFHHKIVEGWLMPRPMIEEWGSILAPDLVFPTGIVCTAYLACWVGLAFLSWRRRPQRFPAVLLIFLATGFEGIRHLKLLPLAILTTLILGPRLQLPSLPRIQLRPGLARGLHDGFYLIAPATLIVLGVIACIGEVGKPDSTFRVTVSREKGENRFPVGAMRFLQEQKIHGNLWCHFNHGEFLLWCLYPQMQVSMDGRYEEVYPEEVFKDNVAFYSGEPDIEIPLKYPTTHILAPANMEKLNGLLSRRSEWTLIYEDQYDRVYATDARAAGIATTTIKSDPLLDDVVGDLSRFRVPGSSR